MLPSLWIAAAASPVFPANLCLPSPPPRAAATGGALRRAGRGETRAKQGWPTKGRKNQIENEAWSRHTKKAEQWEGLPIRPWCLSSHLRSLLSPALFLSHESQRAGEPGRKGALTPGLLGVCEYQSIRASEVGVNPGRGDPHPCHPWFRTHFQQRKHTCLLCVSESRKSSRCRRG